MKIRLCGLAGLALLGASVPQFAQAQMNFPYNVTYPSGVNGLTYDATKITAHWGTWKTARIRGWNTNFYRVEYDASHVGMTSSEGQGYGMIMAAYFGDQDTFDKLNNYRKSKSKANGLMPWLIGTNGQPDTNNNGSLAATDGDEDMAFALIVAAAKWGKSNAFGFDYMAEARVISNSLLANCVSYVPGQSFVFRSQDGVLNAPDDNTNPSYFSPAWYRLFQEASGNTDWTQVINKSFSILWDSHNPNTGLIPNWCNVNGTANTYHPDYYYGYEAFRIPWRCGIDYSWNSNADSGNYSGWIGDFYKGKSADGNGILASRFIDQGGIYWVQPGNASNNGNFEDLCFLAGAASGMHTTPTSDPTINAARKVAAQKYCDTLIARGNNGNTDSSGNGPYYQSSWQILAELFITGNMPDPRSWNLLRQDNPDFETVSNWQTWSPNNTASASFYEGNNASGTIDSHKGKYHRKHWSAGPHNVFTFQTKTVPNGTYTARAWAKCDSGFTQAQFLVKEYNNNANNDIIRNITTNYWSMLEIKNIVVTNGKCTIGFRTTDTGGRSMSADDVTLIKQP
jgi:endo-1,4-beta-D-glucanase Y